MTKPLFTLTFATLLSWPLFSWASWTNYNSIMLGDRVGGLGGAGTALTEDPAAGAFYNPAVLARLEGSSLSTSVSLFNKYDVTYGSQEELDEALFRINKGSILSIPSASGIFSSFRSFTAGVSIAIPDFRSFGGDIHRSGNDTTFLRLDDHSLWVGGAFALNLTERDALGMTFYYTSRSHTRSLTNRYDTGSEVVVYNEEKTFSQNSIVYILGYYRELSTHWRMGASYRFRSIQVSGEGSFLQSEIGTVSGAQPIVQNFDLKAETRIPDRLNLGFVFTRPRDLTLSLDLSYHGANRYRDFNQYADQIVQEEVVNAAFGYETYLEPWLALRLGLFTDFAATPKVPAAPARRYQDHIDKYGFSANIGIHTTAHTTVSLGGYYLGGTGHAAERIGANMQRIEKTDRVFSFLVGSSYSF